MSAVIAVSRTARPAAPSRVRRSCAGLSPVSDVAYPTGVQTLDALIVDAWEELAVHRTVACPICRTLAMRPRYGSSEAPVAGGRCGDCGSVLG